MVSSHTMKRIQELCARSHMARVIAVFACFAVAISFGISVQWIWIHVHPAAAGVMGFFGLFFVAWKAMED